ncbi:MAG TPA: enoyl-CoA hydratase/isomerase family protein, partial [Terriglobia bacterium]|nr:enoyl-CoA hydratase/isomerase family protein [Terriglobia bacterium]
MSYKNLQLEENGGIATLTLNRPEKRNALTLGMMGELHAAWDEVEASAARALIMTGAGKSFCSGMDLAALKSRSPAAEETAGSSSETVADSRQIADLFLRLYNFPKPVIAAVNGHAVAGGCGLATLCDVTLAVPEAKFGYPEVRVGFMPAFV